MSQQTELRQKRIDFIAGLMLRNEWDPKLVDVLAHGWAPRAKPLSARAYVNMLAILGRRKATRD